MRKIFFCFPIYLVMFIKTFYAIFCKHLFNKRVSINLVTAFLFISNCAIEEKIIYKEKKPPLKTHLVLTMEGGGTRGILAAQFLKLLEDEIEKKTGKTIPEVFDVFSGVSIGAIHALFLASNPANLNNFSGNTAEDMLNLYTVGVGGNIAKIFKTTTAVDSTKGALYGVKFLGLVPVGINPIKAVEYFSENIHTLDKMIGFGKFSIGIRGLNTVYGESKKNFLESLFGASVFQTLEKQVIVSAYEYKKKKALYFSSYNPRTNDVRISDIADAASAVPLYFDLPKFNIQGEPHYFMDGAVLTNNICHITYQKIKNKYSNRTNKIKMLSLSTAMKKVDTVPENNFDQLRTAGLSQWIKNPATVPVLVSTITANALHMCESTLKDDFMHISFENTKTPTLGMEALMNVKESHVNQLKDAASLEFQNKGEDVMNFLLPEIQK